MQRSEKAQAVVDSFRKKVNRQAALSFGICAHCGQCTDSCHYYLATGDPKMAPAYKADQVRKLYKYHTDWMGKVAPKWVGGKTVVSDEDLEALKEVVFGNCTMCRRCTLNCPMGVDMALLIRTARSLLTEVGVAPQGVLDVSKDQWEHGNQMAVDKQDYIETIEWLSEELQAEVGDANAVIPLNKEGADLLYAINPREVKYAPLSLLASAKVFYAVGENWTMASEGWDNTNFGLFSGDNALGAHMGNLVFDAVERLGAKKLVTSECGHGFRATKWESPNWTGRKLSFPIENYLETMQGYIQSGRLKLDPSVNAEPVTYHDPCNLGRSSGMTEEPRFVLQHCCTEFVEMHPNRADNLCCSGGGGAMSMSEYTERRLQVAKPKADQLAATGAKVVATACHNCVDALSDLIKRYKLDMRVKTVGELFAEALVLPERPARATTEAIGEVRRKVLVVDDELDTVTFLTTLLEDNGYQVVSTTDSTQALELIRQEKPDLLTLDLLMPRMAGTDLYREIRAGNNGYGNLPVIIVTGISPEDHPDLDFRQFIYQHSLPRPDGFVEKPVEKEQFLLSVRKVLESAQETQPVA
ncbi:MAG: hypothetical protein COZ06_29000 [Armatimonadetes bacterium CG_4_10_14_3_um_filter_66_18]|nr:response regulator [Armatimonadota bacterium]OIO93150.1 MAG: hypothetical protein AUJ96_30920 [Armatimonadetes bacterium CG2_30_66_41]PIU88849.1 MAG: hypothetical protein COS65_30000 [Armatimonadetes bacterium CG06_land_8_20_14_3_00_66_21]PIW12754.1 MAG: hypothetical protein COW34_13435 [Armatimonadetes bacterium CG17_big_fil_post_rev_8_21_14_2_50_66_6]PIX46952.1 MAG: hypothetical protein COZ57_09805 [Armatimonadetes bacterium CG_4_8_14_3_um_filter_66_20]PIY39892.1 MAG: hypothetical protein